MMADMVHTFPEFNQCLAHQLPETQASPMGLVCPLCKQHLFTSPPSGRCLTYWESQPVAYSPFGEPCFVYVLAWSDFRIRALHPAGSHVDPRGIRVRQTELDVRGAPHEDEAFDVEDDADEWTA